MHNVYYLIRNDICKFLIECEDDTEIVTYLYYVSGRINPIAEQIKLCPYKIYKGCHWYCFCCNYRTLPVESRIIVDNLIRLTEDSVVVGKYILQELKKDSTNYSCRKVDSIYIG